MFICKGILSRTSMWRKPLVNLTTPLNITRYINTSGVTIYQYRHKYQHNDHKLMILLLLHRKCHSKGLLEGDLTELSVRHGKELKKITELFPQPRVTLNELSSKTPDKVFEIHYKQNTVAPKGRKKSVQHNDWTCTYAFVWPEKIKFESTAISKRQAAEKAATQAIHWLYINQRINSKGHPVYDNTILDDIRNNLNEPLAISISEKSKERIERIWKEYEEGIKDIYEKTFKEAQNKMAMPPAVLHKDSTIDDDDFEDDIDAREELNEVSELKHKIHPVYGRTITAPKPATMERRNRTLERIFQEYDENLTPLPIDEYSDQITSTVARSRVTILVGAAGCGKSSRAPTAILRSNGANTTAIVSEPRRVAAIGLAERAAQQLGEEVGDTIGYQVRLHSKPPRPPAGSILYCTSGVLLRRLQSNPGLEGCSHVFIDEAHERDVNTDLTLLLLKNALTINPELRLVVMSATLDVDVFTRYFDSCPIVEVPGRTYPVEVSHLGDIQRKYNLALPNTKENCLKEDGKPHVNCQEVVDVIKAVDKNEADGAILVFLPGWSEIKLTKQILDEQYGNPATHLVLPVHSRLSTSDQTKMFAKPPPGVRKIVLATNIAETAITIPDVVHVVDSGAHKENRIKEGTGTASLETVWVSLAGARQRTGRAGRVQPGHCYRLYTKDKESEFAPHTTPEILRIPLEQTVLDCKTYAPDVKISDFLSQLPEPPNERAIQFAVNDLIDLGALTPSEQLTRLGSLLSSLTLHPRLGRGVLNAAVIGNLVAVANAVTHCSQNTELFVNAPDRREEIREIKRKFSSTSDHSALHYIQDEFETTLQSEGRKDADAYCDRYGMRTDRLNFVKSLSNLHIEQVLKSGMIAPTTDAEELNRFSQIDELISAVLLSGANSLIFTKKHVKTKGKLATVVSTFTSNGDRAHISTESLNYGITKRTSKPSLLAYFGGYHSTERRALVVYKTSLISPHAAILFCDGDVLKDMNKGDDEITVLFIPKHKLQIHIPTSQAEHLLKAKEMLWKTIKYYVERKIITLDFDENTALTRFKIRLVKAIGRILVEADREYIQGKARIDNVEDLDR